MQHTIDTIVCDVHTLCHSICELQITFQRESFRVYSRRPSEMAPTSVERRRSNWDQVASRQQTRRGQSSWGQMRNDAMVGLSRANQR